MEQVRTLQAAAKVRMLHLTASSPPTPFAHWYWAKQSILRNHLDLTALVPYGDQNTSLTPSSLRLGDT